MHILFLVTKCTETVVSNLANQIHPFIYCQTNTTETGPTSEVIN